MQKSELNRSILATGWGQLESMLKYKCREVTKVPAPYTNQRCNNCGYSDNANRLAQSKFRCMACGHADYAANILAYWIGAAARRGAFSLEPPMTREIDTRRAA